MPTLLIPAELNRKEFSQPQSNFCSSPIPLIEPTLRCIFLTIDPSEKKQTGPTRFKCLKHVAMTLLIQPA